MNNKTYITNSVRQTQDIARKLALEVNAGDCLVFYGNLGSGKTTFIQALAKNLGIKRRIISPTFIIVRTYDLRFKTQDVRPKIEDLRTRTQDPRTKPQGQNIETFYHIDLYRTETKQDLLSVGLDQILNDSASIMAIEWAEKMKDLLPKKRIELHFKYIDENKREIRIEYINF